MTAFTVGSPKKAAILIEATLLERLNLPETVAVMAHETAHIVNRDLWLMNLADIITRISALMSVMGQLMVLVFLPFYMLENIPVPWLGLIILLLAPVANALLQSSLSRIREFDADITAARLLGETPFLITALSKIDREERTLLRTLLFPGRNEKVPSLLRTHPPTQERISRLAALKLPDAFPPFAYSDYTPKKTPYQSTARHALIRYLTGQRH
jgi:heat shock protein HtpX